MNKKRDEYLRQLAPIAPQWEKAIREREGMHGMATVPSNIEAAWRWKQYSGIIENIIAEPFLELQKQSLFLSKEYRKVTEQFVENSAWYYLLQKTEADIKMKQALQGWKQTVKKIGKGTGKNAPMYRAEARKLMVRCQEAVPVWIMTISKALESLNPSINKFDVIIIDEASQSNISSLAVLYMGKKLIIVGDDKQVSPMGVGVETDKINALRDMYITNKIPNAHLYDAKTSIYDIAATTFQPLMLREHFRCVPEIINFSNSLSYDFKIKPLRDSSSSILLPAILNYQVSNGEKIGKSNPNEAKTIVALLKACIEQPEYEGKSFGVISLLGDDQVKIIQEEIYRRIDAKECSKRRILCGNASNFQGDERDIIFLSMVDCANGNGPIAKLGFGVDDSNRKRYNVACSRAKDQLWVVNSLDSSNDLKSGDIRKMLIDYSRNPESLRMLNQKVEEKSESVFESSVGKYLVARGYHLVQQWEVGAYRLDIVVVYGNRKMVIECDGDRYHSGESKIREDMERQTILERLGWRFIRIRGSEYFRNPEKTMEKVVKLLADEGIEPENLEKIPTIEERDTDLLQRVKQRAHTILYEDNEIFSSEMCTISSALDSKKEVNLQKSHKLSIPVIIEDTSF
ncbi:MAG: AAA domain-containing protein [Eubacteriales bacterium]|nr:AAA domain-containing protein [Eubacteriales bacterium]